MFGPRPLAALFACLFASAALAGPPRGIDEANFRRLTRVGPFTTDLQGKANFRVPTGYRMVLEDKLTEFAELSGLPVVGDEVGYLMMADRPTWTAVVLLAADDPLKGIDPKALGEPAVRSKLLEWQQRFHEGRRPRKGSAVVPGKVAAWTHPPKYDEKAKVLTMGVRLEAEAEGQKDKVNYQTFTYGPDGTVVAVSAFADVENFDKAEREAGKLAAEVTFPTPPPTDPTATAGEDATMYWAKIVGGGVAGAVVVVVLFKLLGGSRQPVRARRPVARR